MCGLSSLLESFHVNVLEIQLKATWISFRFSLTPSEKCIIIILEIYEKDTTISETGRNNMNKFKGNINMRKTHLLLE